MRALEALFKLAWRALFLQPLAILFRRRGSRGKQLFLANYGGDALVAYTPADRAALVRFRGCINSGLCDAVCPTHAQPSLFPLAWSRATPDLRAVKSALARLDACGDCHACQDACPRSVPLLEIFEFTRRKAAEVERA